MGNFETKVLLPDSQVRPPDSNPNPNPAKPEFNPGPASPDSDLVPPLVVGSALLKRPTTGYNKSKLIKPADKAHIASVIK